MANQGMLVVSAAACTKANPASSGSENSLVRTGENGADAEVAGAGEYRRVELGAVVGRDADQQVGADDPAGVAHRDVVLAQVYAVGTGQPRQVGAVVEDEASLRLGGQDPDLAGTRKQFAVGKVLLAQFDDISAAGQCLADDPGQVAQGRQAADQDHQLRFAQRCGTHAPR